MIPNLLGPKEQLHGRQFFHGLRGGRWFRDDSSTLHLLRTLFLSLLHELYLRSSGIRSWRLGTLYSRSRVWTTGRVTAAGGCSALPRRASKSTGAKPQSPVSKTPAGPLVPSLPSQEPGSSQGCFLASNILAKERTASG